MWLVVDEAGTLNTSDVCFNPDHVPDLHPSPMGEAAPPPEADGVLVVGRSYDLTFSFDGNLGAGSTVGLLASTGGVVRGVSVIKSRMQFVYTPAAFDVLRFTAVAPDLGRTARRLFRPVLVNLGPNYVPNTLSRLTFVDGLAAAVTADFDRVLGALGAVQVLDAAGGSGFMRLLDCVGPIHAVLPLQEAARAHAMLEAGTVLGTVVLQP